MEEPEIINEHETVNLEDEDDDHIEPRKEEEDFNDFHELEAKINIFKFAKLGESKELQKLLDLTLKKFRDEKSDKKNISLNNTKYKSKFDKFLNEPDDLGNSPQHYAARGGHLEVIRALDEKGANLQAKGQNDLKVAQFAARYGEDEHKVWECIKAIRDMEKPTIWKPLSRGLDLGEQDKYGYNILHHAIQNEHWRDEKDALAKSSEISVFKGSYIIKQLINLKEIKVGHSDAQENSTIHLALLHMKPEVVSFIFDRANGKEEKETKLREVLKQKNKSGKLPLHIACQSNIKDNAGSTRCFY